MWDFERTASGYSLVELLVVLTIITVTLAVVPAFVGGDQDGDDVRAAGWELARALKSVRGLAIRTASEEVLIIDVNEKAYGLPKGEVMQPLPGNLELSVVTADTERLSEATGGFRFFPDGSSTGGAIEVIGQSMRLTVEVDWLSGAVRIHDGEKDDQRQWVLTP